MPKSNDLELYERRADEWWEPSSKAFRSLRSVNDLRIEIVREWLGPRLAGARIVDIGCGGGFLSEPLIGHGARVVGLDISHGSARAATRRLGARFVQGCALRTPFASASADMVMLADVVEHVRPFEGALAEAARVLVDGGFLFVNTINRTMRARLLAVTVAEGLGFVPRGTHDADMFVSPAELTGAARALGLECVRLQGEVPDLVRTLKRWTVTLRRSDDLSVGYSALFCKRPPIADAVGRGSGA
jgi:2-polyprenyl-6-hydroxyphenyl methylase/3-demethylubiquinone-9 3-methyltransferase